jgi:hypothetical protein
MRPSGPAPTEWRPILGVVLGTGLMPFLLGASAAPVSASCPWNQTPRAVFDVADRADLARHIPGLAKTPEVAGDPILVNGKPAGLEGPLHVTVYDCLRGGAIPAYLPLGGTLPAVVRNVVVVQKLDRDAWWFTDVDLTELTP